MGTVMYNYSLDKADLWPTMGLIRSYYLENWPYLEAFRKTVEQLKGPAGAMEALRQVEEVLSDHSHLSDLQLFDDGYAYIIRPLEKGWFFHSNYKRWGALTPVTLDTRDGDDPRSTGEIIELKRMAEWVGRQIDLRRYLIYPLISRSDFADVAMASMMRMIKVPKKAVE